MGIPSYFKRLTESVNGLLVSDIQGDTLLLDFNCIVYGCLRNETLLAFNGEDTWEHALNEEVCKYVVKIWEAAGKPSKVYIAVDGVVPMAKIKQQRMRRFKSVWWAQKEIEVGVRKRDALRWDTNAITPGTIYMEKLAARLQQLCHARGWTVSTSDEPGEGEHKVMEWLRRNPVEGSIIIYGLDADLILLSMLTSVQHLGDTKPIYLMREKAEFGKNSPMPFLFLSITNLTKTLAKGEDVKSFIPDYIAVMSLLGNDFLPHSLTIKIRDGGHEELLDLLHQFRSNGKRFVTDGTICRQTFHELFCIFAESEEANLIDAIIKKRKMRPMNPRNDTERLMQSVQILPIMWFEEKKFIDNGKLSVDWRGIYHSYTPPEAVGAYLHGLQWILDYYSGKYVNTLWFYPWHLPPTWIDLVETSASAIVEEATFALKPQEQLALVLPMESWHLIRDKKLRKLPILLPQFWPHSFQFHTLGKNWMWECEANVPILLPMKLRSLTDII